MGKRRKRGEGSVHLRKDGRWEGRYVMGYNEKGLPKTKNVLARSKSECLEKLKLLRESCKRDKEELEIGKQPLTFGAWLDYWYQNHCKTGLRITTQKNYENAIYRHLIPGMGQISLDKLTTGDLQQYYTGLKEHGRLLRTELYGEGLSDRTVRGIHAICRAALERAEGEGLISGNPALGCKLPPKKGREQNTLTQEEIQRFLIQAREEGCYELFLLTLATGMRRGEILALRWDDLNPKTGALQIARQLQRIGGRLVLTEPKTKAAVRTVILPRPILKVLEDYRRRMEFPSRWMFPSPVKEDAPLDPASVRKRLERVLERAQCDCVRFHDLRHTFATMALEHGMDVKTLSTIIGHVSSSTTLDIYTHITDEMRTSAALKIDRGIGKAADAGMGEATRQEAVPKRAPFQPYKGKRRKPGTGCISQINDHLWEGRYSPVWPDGVKRPRNVYAHDWETCETLLAELIARTKAEIAAEKARRAGGRHPA